MIPVVYRDIGFLMVYASFSKQGIAELSRSQRSTIGAREPIGSWHPRNFGSEKIVRTYVYVLFVRIACCSHRPRRPLPEGDVCQQAMFAWYSRSTSVCAIKEFVQPS